MSTYNVIGLMSGTSLDGLDIAYCQFQKISEAWHFQITKTSSITYQLDFKNQLKNATQLSSTALLQLHNQYGDWLGNQVKKFIINNNLEVDFIASHGHTVFHQPQKGFTFQIGSGQHLANTSGHTTICDFRTNDVALGGQGAPLVPIGDQLLFDNYDYCLNLGGISNLSFDHLGQRLAYDISPANMLLNYICQKIDLEFDEGGTLASRGTPNAVLLAALNNLNYYKKNYPKSLGYEWFLEQVIPIIDQSNENIENLLRTCVEHITDQICSNLNHKRKKSTVLVTGGGAKNSFLIETLQQKTTSNCSIIVPTNTIIEFKEALIFGFLGVLRYRNEINCLASVTGAKKDSSSGVIFEPR